MKEYSTIMGVGMLDTLGRVNSAMKRAHTHGRNPRMIQIVTVVHDPLRLNEYAAIIEEDSSDALPPPQYLGDQNDD